MRTVYRFRAASDCRGASQADRPSGHHRRGDVGRANYRPRLDGGAALDLPTRSTSSARARLHAFVSFDRALAKTAAKCRRSRRRSGPRKTTRRRAISPPSRLPDRPADCRWRFRARGGCGDVLEVELAFDPAAGVVGDLRRGVGGGDAHRARPSISLRLQPGVVGDRTAGERVVGGAGELRAPVAVPAAERCDHRGSARRRPPGGRPRRGPHRTPSNRAATSARLVRRRFALPRVGEAEGAADGRQQRTLPDQRRR